MTAIAAPGEKARGSSSWARRLGACPGGPRNTRAARRSKLLPITLIQPRESVTAHQGVYQIGDVYPRSWVVISTSSGMSIPNRKAS